MDDRSIPNEPDVALQPSTDGMIGGWMFGRRALIGAGLLSGAQRAEAASAAPGPHAAAPALQSVGSPPVNTFVYRVFAGLEFYPLSDDANNRKHGNIGWYTSVHDDTMMVAADVPPGALLREVEFYVYNESGASISAFVGLAPLDDAGVSVVVSVSIPSSSDPVQTVRAFVPAGSYGPYPLGSKLIVGIATKTAGTVQVLGARLGFQYGGSRIGVLDTPIRVYSSASDGGAFAANETRTVTLPAAVVYPGTTGVVLNVVTSAPKPGTLKLYNGGVPTPAIPVVYFPAGASDREKTVSVSQVRQIKITASAPVNVILTAVGRIT